MRGWFTASAALAMFAVVVQIMVPFVLAADIAAAANATPICQIPTGGDQKHPQKPVKTCPICTALAATVAATSPAPPAIQLPRVVVMPPTVAPHEDAADITLLRSYRSRAPPVA